MSADTVTIVVRRVFG